MIDINYLKQLLEIFDESSANDLRIEQEGASIKLSKTPRRDESPGGSQVSFHYPSHAAAAPTPPTPVQSEPSGTAAQTKPDAETADPGATGSYHEIRSPIVGTFYRAPSPDADNYVEVGQEVSPGAVLCIVEAMKLMNEIECDTYGKIVRILVENAQPVEYNQLLFLVEPE